MYYYFYIFLQIHRQIYAEAESRANLFARRHCPQTSGGLGLTDGGVAGPACKPQGLLCRGATVFLPKANIAEDEVCRRQIYATVFLPKANIAEAEVCRRQIYATVFLPKANIAEDEVCRRQIYATVFLPKANIAEAEVCRRQIYATVFLPKANIAEAEVCRRQIYAIVFLPKANIGKFLNYMKHTTIISLALTAALACIWTGSHAQNQQEKPKTTEEMASQQADLLGERLNLEYWQVFYVDSILRTNFKGMEEDIKRLGAMNVSMESLYMEVQDKWGEKTDEAFKKLFTDEQWKKYLTTGAKKAIKEREKRKKAREQNNAELQDRLDEGRI